MSRRHHFRQSADRRRRLLAAAMAAAVILGATLVGAAPVSAQGECSPIDRGGTRCRIGEGGGGDPAPGERTVSTSSGPRLTFQGPTPWLYICDASAAAGWSPVDDIDTAVVDFGFLPGAGDPVEPGSVYTLEVIDQNGVGTNAGYIACVGDSEPPPPSPPPPPTPEEIWGAALTFTPLVNTDPYVRGLTGLETYLWYEGPTTDSVALALGPYGVTATIEAQEFIWEMGSPDREGYGIYTSGVPGGPGGAADAAAIHLYALPGAEVIVHRIRWTGDAVLTGPGLPLGGVTVDLGEAVLSTARAYDVIEVRTPVLNG